MATYDKGDLVRVTGTFKNTAGTNTDPTAITFKFQTPAGVSTTYVYLTDAQLVKSATGIYYVDLSITQDGIWTYRFIGTGAVETAQESTLFVDDSAF